MILKDTSILTQRKTMQMWCVPQGI